jgi:hypothetical protein
MCQYEAMIAPWIQTVSETWPRIYADREKESAYMAGIVSRELTRLQGVAINKVQGADPATESHLVFVKYRPEYVTVRAEAEQTRKRNRMTNSLFIINSP